MKISEAPMLKTLLCKNAKAEWSEVFEITKFATSPNGSSVYVRMVFGMPGQNSHIQHFWRDAKDMDARWEVIDVLT